MLPRGCLRSTVLVSIALGTTGAGCASTGFPWPATAPAASAVRTDVTTANSAYRRATSHVLVRTISQPSRASLDYAAYHANFMNADPAPEGMPAQPGKRPSTAHPFGGVVVPGSLTGSVAATRLTPEERKHALALAPLVELLASKRIAGADRLEEAVARIRAEDWGLGGGPQLVRQTAVEAFLHGTGAGPVEIWVKIELAPWFRGFASPPDEDGDGVPEIYGQLDPAALGPTDAIADYVRSEYEGRVLAPTEVKAWAHQLASYWYPSYNTDLVADPEHWPNATTEAAVRAELGSTPLPTPTVVMRGKPEGIPVYNVFVVAAEDATAATPVAAGASPHFALPPSKPTPDTAPVKKAVAAELGAHGGTWTGWVAEVAKLRAAVKQRLEHMPAGSKAIAGRDGFLFFRNSLAYVLGGDLGKQKGDRNPIPVIVEFGKLLSRHGVDFLFVPVPTKVEIFPDKVAGADADLDGFAGKVVNPFARKFMLDLAERGIETVDLLPAFLAERTASAKAAEPLYQAQDTHWTTRGLELAARLVAERIKRYPWYARLASHRRSFTTKDESFTRHGDLYARLPEAERGRFQPETLTGHQVVNPDGSLYDDDPESPIVVLGDSFTGVYQLMDCEHAGVSAHLARDIGYPVDLVMSYGGGPNVREKLLRRGVDKLSGKKLVIWMMTARDLYDHAEGWQPLPKP